MSEDGSIICLVSIPCETMTEEDDELLLFRQRIHYAKFRTIAFGSLADDNICIMRIPRENFSCVAQWVMKHEGAGFIPADKVKAVSGMSKEGLRPCPMCGKDLSIRNVFFMSQTEDGPSEVKLGELLDQKGIATEDATAMDFAITFCDRSDPKGDGQSKANEDPLFKCLSAGYGVGIFCPCGYSYFQFRDKIDFPHIGWLTRFKDVANVRWTDGA